METKTFKVDGMHCQSCEVLLKEVLEELPGVKSAKVSMKSASAIVEFDKAKSTEAQIKKTIQDQGYKTP